MRHATTAIGSALSGALVAQERGLRRRLPAARRGDVTAVHRARVASRRLREILALAVAVDPESDADDLSRAVRRLTRALGPTREMDVAIQEFDQAAARHGWPPAVVSAIRRRLQRTRDDRARHLVTKSERFARAGLRADLDTLAARMRATPDAVWLPALTRRMSRRADRVLTAAAACGTLYAPDRLHELRIAIKKLRYALELAPPSAADPVRAAIGTLKQAQERFGRLHDLQVLEGEVRAIDTGRRPRSETAALADVYNTLERECREIHARSLALIASVEAVARDVRRRPKALIQGPRLVMARAVAPVAEAALPAAGTGSAGS